ncbi:MAG: S24 family peptidase [Planctomycetota bacterium]|nr:S24 family peptidase [Planctomycetota bacterium]
MGWIVEHAEDSGVQGMHGAHESPDGARDDRAGDRAGDSSESRSDGGIAEGVAGGEESLGDVVRRRRRELGLSLAAAADEARCAKSYLSALENGRCNPPTPELLARLERTLKLQAGRLVRIAAWMRTPASVRAEVERWRDTGQVLKQLRTLLGRDGDDAASVATHEQGEATDGVSGAELELDSTVISDADGPRGSVARELEPGGPKPGGAGDDADGSRRGRDRIRSRLDEAYHSGELRRLIEKLDGGSGDGLMMLESEGRGGERISGRGSGGTGGGANAGVGGGAGGVSMGAPVGLPVEVPLINSVAAGYPREFTDLGYPARSAGEYVRCPEVSDPDAFAARVVGDSMSPEYREGDIVVFSPARLIKSGMDCFARLEPDQETTFKRVYFDTDEAGGVLIRLQPLNNRYPPKVVPREGVAGLYAAVSVIRKIG